MFRRAVAGLWVLACLVLGADPAGACRFCCATPPTLREEAARPGAVIFVGTALKSREIAEGGGETTFRVEEVLRPHRLLGKKKTITLPKYIPIEPNSPSRYLICCDTEGGRLDPYRGLPVETRALPDYFRKLTTLGKMGPAARLRFFFDYLEHADPVIAQDAFGEFAKAGDQDIARAAAKFDPARLRRWLASNQTLPSRRGTYAVMMGACGTAADVDLVRAKIASSKKGSHLGLDGLLTAYVLLDPEAGWKKLRDTLADSSGEFIVRYAGLRAVRYLKDARPGIIPRPELARGAAQLLAQSDIADLAIEDLRKWGQWDYTDSVLALAGTGDRQGFEHPVVQRAILRFALRSPQQAAKAFVTRQRMREPQTVADAEELLNLEEDLK